MKPTPLNISIIAAAIIVALGLMIGLISFEKKSDYITVGGQSEVTINPDRAVLYFSLTTDALTADDAQKADSATFTKIQAALKGAGINSLETSSYYLNKRTEWTENGSVDKGYEVSHQLKVTTDVTGATKAITSAVGAGANGVDRIEFLISQQAKDTAVAEAMRQASVSAQAKAKTVTKALGTKLGRALKIEESGYWIIPSSEPADTSSLPAEYQNNVIAPQRMAVQGNVNMVFKVN